MSTLPSPLLPCSSVSPPPSPCSRLSVGRRRSCLSRAKRRQFVILFPSFFFIFPSPSFNFFKAKRRRPFLNFFSSSSSPVQLVYLSLHRKANWSACFCLLPSWEVFPPSLSLSLAFFSSYISAILSTSTRWKKKSDLSLLTFFFLSFSFIASILPRASSMSAIYGEWSLRGGGGLHYIARRKGWGESRRRRREEIFWEGKA